MRKRMRLARQEGRKIESGWTPWEPGTVPTEFTEEQITTAMQFGNFSREGALQALNELRTDVIWINNYFQVNVRSVTSVEGWPAMLHLSVKRRDRQPLGVEHFRVLQRIKNDLVGPSHEAVELYPAEESLIDTANQYHLWVLVDATHRFPFGFRSGRTVLTESIGSAVQRPFAGAADEN